MDQYWATTDVDWFWLILIDSDQFWSILIDATGCWLILIDDNGYWLILIDTDRSIFLFVVRCLFPSFFNEQNSLYRGENCARSLSSKPTLPSVQIYIYVDKFCKRLHVVYISIISVYYNHMINYAGQTASPEIFGQLEADFLKNFPSK